MAFGIRGLASVTSRALAITESALQRTPERISVRLGVGAVAVDTGHAPL